MRFPWLRWEEAARFAEKIIHKAASLEVRSIDTKLMNTEKMFEIINQRLDKIEKALRVETMGPRSYDSSLYNKWAVSGIGTQATFSEGAD